ncbi:STAS domain-containing protein [Candidatus Fermentibacteria bacterium]|nr:STAS domain-containing protein [Candidatus Fermentibacteria bacterium]
MNEIACRSLGTPRAVLIEAHGRIQGLVSQELRDVVWHQGYHGTQWMVFDLRHATALDSMALGALLLARSLCARHQGQAVLLGLSPPLITLLEALGLRDLFMLAEDMRHGLDALHRLGVSAEADA